MQPLIEKSPEYLRRWIDQQGIGRDAVARILEGVDISSRRQIPELAGGQQPEVFIPDLTATPWWDNARFPWISGLEATVADVTAEFHAAGGLTGDRTLSQPSELTDGGRWSALYLYCSGQANARNIELCPRTVAALGSIDAVTGADGGMCYFSIMDPHTHVSAHTGYTNAHLRCHLSLVAQPDARLRVGNETRQWEEGKVVVFDDSFNHEAWNDSDLGRAVLLFDIWHPDLNDVEVRALTYMMRVWRRLLARSYWMEELVAR